MTYRQSTMYKLQRTSKTYFYKELLSLNTNCLLTDLVFFKFLFTIVLTSFSQASLVYLSTHSLCTQKLIHI